MTWIAREIVDTLRTLHRQRPALLLTGSRQVGKTSLLERTFADHRYASLDLPAVAEEAETAGEQFLERHPPPLILDEVQYAPKLFRYLKHAIDRDRGSNGRYLLTGSQKLSLMHGASESLAGRVSVVDLYSLSLREIETLRRRPLDRRALLEAMFAGGYPDLVANDLSPARYYADYVATYLERDVRQIVQVRSLRDFDRFLRLCALRTGQLLSMNALAADVGTSPNTIRSWLSVLEASGVILLLEPYFRNLGKRIVKTPKLYFLDTGLASFLAGFDGPRALGGSALIGPMFETLALGQMVRHFANRGLRPNLYFYRDHQGNEVDFVIPIGEKLRLIECKWSETPSPGARGFDALTKALGPGGIIDRTILVPVAPGRRSRDGVAIEGCVQLRFLDGAAPAA